MTSVSSRVIKDGNGQAVRIPPEFRLASSRVEISRVKNGDLLIHAVPEDRGTGLLEALACFENDFIDLPEEDRRTQPALQYSADL